MSRHHAPSAVSTPDPVRARRCSRAAAPAAWAALIAGALAGGAPAVLPAQTSSGGGGSATARHMREGCTAEEMAMHERAQQFRREIVRTQSSTAHGRGGDSIRIRLVPRQPSPAEERELRALVEAGRSASGMFQVRHGPSGWIGVSISGPSVQWVTPDGQATIRYCAYPEVVSVEPASPARRAGIVAGDTVLAYNGRDVTKTSVALDTLLVPGGAGGRGTFVLGTSAMSGRRPMVTMRSSVRPSRRTLIRTRAPGTSSVSSATLVLVTSRPLYASTVSPATIPARRAGDASSTETTSGYAQ
jgi:hypothetical protein